MDAPLIRQLHGILPVSMIEVNTIYFQNLLLLAIFEYLNSVVP